MSALNERRGTQRILLLWLTGGGTSSGLAQRIATIAPERPSTCGIRWVGGWNPPRAQTGSAPFRTAEPQTRTPLDAAAADPAPETSTQSANASNTPLDPKRVRLRPSISSDSDRSRPTALGVPE